jgi:DNA (cytosine-5)-methyltransferase 1
VTFGSFCSGIGAPETAWHGLGWSSAFVSEIEPFPCAVLAQRFPGVPNLGDMTKITTDDLERHGPVDLLVAGTPCQSFSVAGLRAGLADPRGNLALEFLRLVDAARPRWVVWENVPGVLSSSGGRDFGAFLGGLGQLGYGWAYRVLDAQFVRVESHPRAVPQRRRRVFVVGCLGSWQRAAAVLLERQSLCGHPAPRREAGPSVAALTANGVGTCGADDNQRDEIRDLNGAAGALAAEPGMKQQTYIAAIRTAQQSSNGHGIAEGAAHTLDSANGQAVAFQERGREGGRACETQEGVAYSLNAPSGGGRRQEMNVAAGMTVRRLTPLECERLQGFPDGWTAITFKGKPAADGPRYKALGNSMAVNVMSWVGQRIKCIDDSVAELGSFSSSRDDS